MNYQAIYNSLIERGRNRLLDGYSERHHIIPRCMGGNNNPENLVKLTAREHFLAHRLLTKIYPDNHGLKCAVFLMSGSKSAKMYFKVTSRTYERLKIQSSLSKSIHQKGRGLTPEALLKARETKIKNGSNRYEKTCESCHKTYIAGSFTGKFCKACKITPCRCGCGQMVVTQGKFYRPGHGPQIKHFTRVCKGCRTTYKAFSCKSHFCDECRKPRPCKCGCGQLVVYPGRYYKPSHDKTKNHQHTCNCQFCGIKYIAGSAVGKTCAECSKPRLCKCGCGAIIKRPGAYFRTKAHKVYFEKKFDK